jgi:hypothetical protein
MNIHFDNFNVTDLVSKGAKQRLKTYIRTEIKDNKSIIDQLNDNTNYLISNYFKEDNKYNLDLTYIIDSNNIHLSLKKNNKHEHSLELERNDNKKKLKDKLQQIKNKRFQARNRNLFLNKEKDTSKLLSLDKRITPEMISAYNLTRQKFGNELPNPHDILNNKDEHIKKFIEYIGMVLKSTNSEEELMRLLDNEYSNYIGIVTGFDYKNILQMIKKNTSNNVPDLASPDNNHACDDDNCNHDDLKPISKDIAVQLVESDNIKSDNIDDMKSDDINSDNIDDMKSDDINDIKSDD